MVRSRFSHLKVEMIRGNVGTRLSKLDNGQYDTLVMAAAGLKRLGLSDRIRSIIPPEVSLPAPGQGAIGIEAVGNDEMTQKYVEALNDEDTRLCTQAERAVSRALGVPARFLWLPTPRLTTVRCSSAHLSATT